MTDFQQNHNAANPEPPFVDPTLFSLYGSWRDGKSEEYRENYAFVRFGLDALRMERDSLYFLQLQRVLF